MRFSIWLSTEQPSSEIFALAEHAERTGWDGIWVADHFMAYRGPASAPRPEAWTTIAGIAARVARVRLGVLVTANNYRHPAVLAKMAATVDQISDGRLVLGLGARWQVNEHEACGIDLPEVHARLEEACEVIRLLHTQELSSFDGRFYRLLDAPCEPKPVQRRLPLLIGGSGETVTMELAARYGDGWNSWGLPEVIANKLELLARHCREIGRDPSSIASSAQALVSMSDDDEQLERWRSESSPRPRIVGTPSQVRETMARYLEIGLDEFVVSDASLGRSVTKKRESMDRIIAEVATDLADRAGA